MKILIIEDEPLAATALSNILKELPSPPAILDVLDTVAESIQWLQSHPAPDLIFMDIQLADGLSLDIFKQVEVTAPVIFTTAFNDYAVEAFQVHAVHYLLKPLDPNQVKDALSRIEQSPPITANLLETIQKKIEQPNYKSRFMVKIGGQLTFVNVDQIAWLASVDGLTELHTPKGQRFILDHTLDSLAPTLDPALFFRINRKMIIHIDCLRQIKPHFNGRLKVELQPAPDFEIFVPRDRVGDFKAWLDM